MKIWNGHKQPGDSGIYPVCCAMLGTPSDWVCFMQRADDTRAHLRAVVPQRQASIGSTTGYITLHRGVDRCAKDPVHACIHVPAVALVDVTPSWPGKLLFRVWPKLQSFSTA